MGHTNLCALPQHQVAVDCARNGTARHWNKVRHGECSNGLTQVLLGHGWREELHLPRTRPFRHTQQKQ